MIFFEKEREMFCFIVLEEVGYKLCDNSRNLYVKIRKESWRGEGKNVFLHIQLILNV